MFRKNTGGSGKTIPAMEFIIAAAVLLLLEAFLFFNFFVGPGMSGANAARDELYARRAALQRYRADKLDTAGLANQLADLEKRIGEAEEKLPQALHNEDISIMIGHFSAVNNITIDSISFQERQLVSPSEYLLPGGITGGLAGGAAAPVYAQGADAYGVNPASAGVNPANTGVNPSNAGVNPANAGLRQSALYDEAPQAGRGLSLQGVQVSFSSEFHTVGPFLKSFEDSGRKIRVKNVSITRVQEGELKGVINLEYASLSANAEQNFPGMNEAPQLDAGRLKDSLFNKYSGFIEDNVDPTILLLSEDDDFDPDFYILLKASTSNETKVSYGIYPRVETELRSNVNNAVRAKLTISGDEEQFEYVYSLASYQKSERRTLTAADGKLRLKVLSCQRIGDNDNVAILLDVDNETDLPFEIIVVNDDVLSPRFHLGITKGNVNVAVK